MTLEEFKQLLALLEQAQAHAEKQVMNLRTTSTKSHLWQAFEIDCLELLTTMPPILELVELTKQY